MNELLDLVEELINDNSIGCYPINRNHGADAYRCPACGKREYIIGNAFGMESIDEVKNHEDCRFKKLQKLVEKLRAAE